VKYLEIQERLWNEFHKTEGSGRLLSDTNSIEYIMKYVRFLEDKCVELLSR